MYRSRSHHLVHSLLLYNYLYDGLIALPLILEKQPEGKQMILVSSVHIKMMRQMKEEHKILCGKCSRKGSFLRLIATWRRRRLEEVDLSRKLFAHPYNWPWLNCFEDCLEQLISEGYQLHVHSAALYSFLLALSERNAGPGYLSAEYPQYKIFSLCIPSVMDLIQQDIFESASDIKEVEGVKKRLIKEASVGRKFKIL